MTGIERYGSSGAHTVEGNVAGSRASKLTKQREMQQKEYEAKRLDIEKTNRRGTRIDENFQSHQDDDESEFKACLGDRQTVGLVTAEEFRKKRENLQNRKSSRVDVQSEEQQKEPKKKKKRKAKKMGPLSFDMDDNDADEEETTRPTRAKKSIKNPNVETDFLPDKEREKEEARERQQLRVEWEVEQERIKNEDVAVTYSYWDGSGHRREITIPKKTTIGKYLELVKQQLVTEFAELRGVSAENLIYIKEDLIIPHHYSFYDLIVTKARGKSGPLFHFDVHDDVRLLQDRRVEKDESHPGKVVDRYWYEKNKHIFPASRWEVYDPNVVREKYTIHGD
ncbi:XAP5 circadian clock regulator [Phytophthora infestans]|uniref:XAP5 circadian clock regulator n=1 Tax=Phytophthora infestans TaxID=4787 RepID=A0A833SJ79_PHYIN|nr:XAP5 circadian clock regulator [Phytophthora infestans]KAF4128441.1 XAP5 circadian clock regulator [Phytophthora infestans]